MRLIQASMKLSPVYVRSKSGSQFEPSPDFSQRPVTILLLER